MNEEEKHKAVQQFKLQLNGALEAFNIYGLGAYIPYVKEIVTELALQLNKRMSGVDHPIDYGVAKKKYHSRRKKK